MSCLVIAHRGASAVRPENTLAAFATAADLGADWVELDVHRSADGLAVVRHDADLPDGRSIAAVAAAELDPAVPPLDAVLALCRERGLGVNVEIKTDPRRDDHDPTYAVVDVVVELLAEHAGREGAAGSPLLVTSFDPACLDAVRARSDVPTGRLAHQITDVARLVADTAAAGHVAINPWEPFVDEAFVAQARSAGLAVYPWTVDDPDRMAALVALGVDGIITDLPDVLVPLVR